MYQSTGATFRFRRPGPYRRPFLSLTLLAMLLLPRPGHATALTASQILTQFNAVISGSYTSNSDIEGRLVTNTLAGGPVFYSPRGTAAPSSFQVINAINIASGVSATVNTGGSVNWVTSNAGSFTMNGGSITRNNPPFSITDFTDPLNALVGQLAGLTANSTVNGADPNSFTFNEASGASTAVFSLTTAQLATASTIKFSGSADTIIINVTGSSFVDNANFSALTDAQTRSIIWNFVNATSLQLRGWNGSILAPLATVTNNSPINGTLYAANFNGGSELHDFTFTGRLPSVPEPASLALLAAGLLGLAGARARRPG